MSEPIDPIGSAAIAVVDCWNGIGVRGDSSCPELKKHIHCRNCPVFAAAAANLLEAAAPSDYLAYWTRQVAQHNALSEHDAQSVLIFRVGAEWLAISTGVLKEIASLRTIHSIPHRRDGTVLGVANIRGELLACVSLGYVLNIDPCAAYQGEANRKAEKRFLVLQRDGSCLVCPVDEVHGIQRFRSCDQAAIPATVAKGTATYTRAVLSWQAKSVGLLDTRLLLDTLNRSLA